MFRITDIQQIAVQIERNGEEAYRKAAAGVADDELRTLFHWMADEEQRHRRWFEELKDETPIPAGHEELEQMGRSLLQDMVRSQTFSLEQSALEKTTDFAELLKQSKGFEEDTILFYRFLRDLIEDPAARRQLDAIIAEEEEHAKRLAELAGAHA